MFRLTFALAAVLVLSLINWYSFARFVSRVEYLKPYRSPLKWGMVAVTLAEIGYFLLLRSDWLSPLWYRLFSSFIGISFMLFCVAIVYDLLHIPYAKIPYNPSKRLLVKTLLDGSMLALVLVYLFQGFSGGAQPPRVREVDVVIQGLKEELSIVQISDVHIGKSLGKTFMDDMVARVNALEPDIVVITGDLIDMPVAEIGDRLDALRELQSSAGVYFVPGNHEYFYGVEEINGYMEFLGIRVLDNKTINIGNLMNLSGVTDMIGKRFDLLPPDLDKALLHVNPKLPTILLSHQPKITREIKDHHRIDLILSGHTHGGQIFPFGLLVLFDQPYLSGLYRHSEQTQIFVSNGTGYWGPPIRVGAPSEIIKLHLKVSQ